MDRTVKQDRQTDLVGNLIGHAQTQFESDPTLISFKASSALPRLCQTKATRESRRPFSLSQHLPLHKPSSGRAKSRFKLLLLPALYRQSRCPPNQSCQHEVLFLGGRHGVDDPRKHDVSYTPAITSNINDTL